MKRIRFLEVISKECDVGIIPQTNNNNNNNSSDIVSVSEFLMLYRNKVTSIAAIEERKREEIYSLNYCLENKLKCNETIWLCQPPLK